MEEQILDLLRATTEFIEQSATTKGGWFETFLSSPASSAAIGALGAIFGSMITLIASSHSMKIQIRMNRNEKLRERYEKQLYEFYNPLVFLLERTTEVYKLFALKEKEDKDYRTLTFLLNGHVFSEYDMSLLDKIIEYNNQISELISANSRFIDDEIVESLVELVNHYDLIKRAREGKLEDNAMNREHAYPREILGTIKKKQENITCELEKL